MDLKSFIAKNHKIPFIELNFKFVLHLYVYKVFNILTAYCRLFGDHWLTLRDEKKNNCREFCEWDMSQLLSLCFGT